MTQDEIEKAEKINQIETEMKQAFENTPFRLLNVSLGLGSEDIEAQAGSSSFQGSSRYWDRILELVIYNKDNVGIEYSKYTFNFDYHFYQTKLVERSLDSDQNQVKTFELHRYYFDFIWEWILLPLNDTHGLNIGIGLANSQAPIMEIYSDATNSTQLNSLSYWGGIIKTDYTYKMGSKISTHIGLKIIPVSSNTDYNFTRFDMSGDIKYQLLEKLTLLSGLKIKLEDLSYTINCQNGDVDCVDDANTSSKINIFHLGFGYAF